MSLKNALYLAFHYIFWGKRHLPLTTVLAVVGMAIGVASLIVAMAVMSGFESTLQKTVVDIAGHLMILKRGAEDQHQALEEVKPLLDGYVASTPFLFLEAVLAEKGQVAGVGIEGLDEKTFPQVLKVEKRVQEGQLSFIKTNDLPGIVIGKGIAKSFQLKVGDTIRLVIPISKGYGGSNFKPKMKKFVINGIVSFGLEEFDSRYIMMDLNEAQNFANVEGHITGFKIKMKTDEQALQASLRIANEKGQAYYISDWQEGNRNLFEAVALEKWIVFFVLLIIVIVACFNIAGTLFISVIRRFKDISVLKTMGASSHFILKIFSIQGMVLGALGTFFGLLLGLAACYGFLYLQSQYGVISSEVYKLDKIELDFEFLDFIIIFSASMLICFLATLAPARRGALLNPVEGLQYK
ncbi:MAG: ABC transporter permease [Bdellovibrionales bacterium]|nr:ABC transporter permease [Bdellovibrionales bacterium]